MESHKSPLLRRISSMHILRIFSMLSNSVHYTQRISQLSNCPPLFLLRRQACQLMQTQLPHGQMIKTCHIPRQDTSHTLYLGYHKPYMDPSITGRNAPLTPEKCPKILSINLDPHLSFNVYSEETTARASSTLQILKALVVLAGGVSIKLFWSPSKPSTNQ